MNTALDLWILISSWNVIWFFKISTKEIQNPPAFFLNVELYLKKKFNSTTELFRKEGQKRSPQNKRHQTKRKTKRVENQQKDGQRAQTMLPAKAKWKTIHKAIDRRAWTKREPPRSSWKRTKLVEWPQNSGRTETQCALPASNMFFHSKKMGKSIKFGIFP